MFVCSKVKYTKRLRSCTAWQPKLFPRKTCQYGSHFSSMCSFTMRAIYVEYSNQLQLEVTYLNSLFFKFVFVKSLLCYLDNFFQHVIRHCWGPFNFSLLTEKENKTVNIALKQSNKALTPLKGFLIFLFSSLIEFLTNLIISNSLASVTLQF